MAPPYLQHSGYRQAVSPGRRAAALALSLGAVALLVLLLVRLGAAPPPLPGGRSLSTFQVGPASQVAERTRPTSKRRAERAAVRAPTPARPVPPPPTLPPTPWPGLLLSREDMAAADVGKMARAPGVAIAAAGEGAGEGDAAAGLGEGPGGARLYEAQWHRRPPANSLALYLPGGAPAGAWATIACRTVADYKVDDCRQLDDFPRGLGLSRALRQAAWQFQVRPPRLGGKPLVGAWVRIRFTFEQPSSKI